MMRADTDHCVRCMMTTTTVMKQQRKTFQLAVGRGSWWGAQKGTGNECAAIKHKLPQRPVQILINSEDIYVPATYSAAGKEGGFLLLNLLFQLLFHSFNCGFPSTA